MKKSSKSHIGTVVHFYETFYSQRLAAYKSQVEFLTPLCQKYKEIGPCPLTTEILQRLVGTAMKEILVEELRLKLKDGLKDQNPLLAKVFERTIEPQLEEFKSLLNEFHEALRRSPAQNDCPIVNGLPTITPEFEESLKEQFYIKVRTEEGSEYYEKFLIAQQAMKDLLETGAKEGSHFDLYPDGLVCNAIYE